MAEPGTLSGVSAVITGASRGIGEAIAHGFVDAGAEVALVARSRGRLEKLAASLGANALAVPCDLHDATQVNAAIATITAKLSKPVSIVVNNAGLFKLGRVHELAAEDFAAMIDVNLVAPFRFIRAFLPAMRTSKSGYIVTIGSVADRAAWPGNAGYAASKFGARALHEVLRAETKGTGVRASLISPSATDTDLWNDLDPDSRPDMPSRVDMLRPEDVARSVMFAVTQPASVNVDELRLSRT